MFADRRSEEFRRIEKIVKNPDFKEPADVEAFFEAYTKYIWDYKMVGQIYDHYCDDTVIHGENGEEMIGIEPIVYHTTERLYTSPDMKIQFIKIIADKISEDEFKFVQITYTDGTFTGPSKYGPPTGKRMCYDNIMDLCECQVKRIDGQWRITEEWGLLGYEDFFSAGNNSKGEFRDKPAYQSHLTLDRNIPSIEEL